MRMKKPICFLVSLCCCVILFSATIFADNFGLEDDFGDYDPEQTTEPTTEETTADTTEESSEETTAVTTAVTTEVTTEETTDEVTDEGTTEPETTEPEESVTDAETTEPAETETETQTTEQTSERVTVPALTTEAETQGEQPSGGLSWQLILAGIAVVGVGCVVVVVLLTVKYFRALKQN